MKTEALKVKPLGEEKPTVINDPDTKIKTRDTKIVDAPLPDSETKTKTDQPSADSVQNTQDHKHCRAGSIKDGQFASKQATSDHKYAQALPDNLGTCSGPTHFNPHLAVCTHVSPRPQPIHADSP